jgi:hypothetical protein
MDLETIVIAHTRKFGLSDDYQATGTQKSEDVSKLKTQKPAAPAPMYSTVRWWTNTVLYYFFSTKIWLQSRSYYGACFFFKKKKT